MSKINVLSLQIACKVGDKKANLQKIKEMLEKNTHTNPDLVVLPEFFSTGVSHEVFISQAEEESASETLAFLSNLAKEYKTNIVCGSIIEKEQNKLYNTSYVLNRQGEIIGQYRKIHLFDFFGGKEGECISKGDKTVVVSTDIGKIGLSICFDIKFPLHFHELMKKGAQIVTCPTAMPVPDNTEWRALNIVRASENALFFISSNQCGECEGCPFPFIGNSMITTPMGEIAGALGGEEGVLFSQIDLEYESAIRAQFPVSEL